MTPTMVKPLVPVHSYVPDEDIWPGVEALATCLCQELIRAALPPTCFCGVVAGVPSFDVAEEDQGIAWTRVVQVFPSTTFPTAAVGVRSCLAPLVAEVEIGVMRCFPGTRTPEGPTETDQWEQARLQQADMAAMYRAVHCCYGKFDEFAIGQYVPSGPEGGYVGGTWQVFLSGWKGR